jgi:hypothetical protein
MEKQIPGLFIPRLRLLWNEREQSKLEEKFRRTRTGADEQDRVSILFRGNYHELSTSFQNIDPNNLWPEERNALYGSAIRRDLDQVYPNDYFFQGFAENGSFNVNAFLVNPRLRESFVGQRIAELSSHTNGGVVHLKNKLFYLTIAGTVEELNSRTGMDYKVFRKL